MVRLLAILTEDDLKRQIREKNFKNAYFIYGNEHYLKQHYVTSIINKTVEKDFKEASKWFKKAAEQGEVNSQVNLGVCYFYGQGVEKDLEESFKWFKEAAKQGHPLAIKYLEKYVK